MTKDDVMSADTQNWKQRVQKLPWEDIEDSLHQWGQAKIESLLTPAECAELIALYEDDSKFRSTINMERYRFGMGEYKYLADPLPLIVQELRTEMYRHLAPVANKWMQAMGTTERYPSELTEFLEICRRKKQTKPTPLILRYEEGGYNCLHQDIYGEVAFPLQLTCALSRNGVDYSGGEFLLVEQRPRAQSRAEVVTLNQGDAVIFANRYRPVEGSRGYYRVNMRHGVSRLLSGRRYTMGIIFHNAK